MFAKENIVLVFLLILVLAIMVTGCAVSVAEAREGALTAPEAVVENFYDWAIDYAGYDDKTGEVFNPMVDGSYLARPELSLAMIESYEMTLASFEEEGGGYDPFLCAQDIPSSVNIGAAEISGDMASVEVETSFPGHSFVVELVLEDGVWFFTDVICSSK